MKITSILSLFFFFFYANAQGPAGAFFVCPLVSGGEGYVGRNLHEDHSLNPKPVLLLNENPPEAASNQK